MKIQIKIQREPLGQLGMMAASAVGGQALGMINDQRQIRQQKELNNIQMHGQMKMTDYNQGKQMEMWRDTNYDAQVKQMKKAGLNPALMYGMGGGGGTTANVNTGSVQGAQAPSGGRETQDIMAMGIQSGLMEAQRRNIEADTEKKKVETVKTAGVDTDKTQAETNVIKLEAVLRDGVLEAKIGEAQWILENTISQVLEQKAKTKVAQETIDAEINTIKARAVGAVIENLLKESNIEVNQASINKMAMDIVQRGKEIDIKQFEATLKQEFPGVGNMAGRITQRAIDGIFQLFGVPNDRPKINK